MATLFLTSCKKDVTVETQTSQASESKTVLPLKYQIDGQEMAKDVFFKTLLKGKASLRSESGDLEAISELYHVLQESARPDPKGAVDILNVFTTEEAYIDYAKNSGFSNVDVVEQAYKDLADYAESSGAVAELESTGVMSASYIRYMNDYLKAHNLPYDESLKTRTLTNFVYRDCNKGGYSWPILRNPWLGMFGMDNNISSYYVFGFIGGRTDIFDRTFYRTRMITIWSWANTTYDFCGGPLAFLNDRASSWYAL